MNYLPYIRKALTALAAGLTSATAANLLPAQYVPYATIALAVLGALGVYAVPNVGAPDAGSLGGGDAGVATLLAVPCESGDDGHLGDH